MYFIALLYVSAAALRFIYNPTPPAAAQSSHEPLAGWLWWPVAQVSASLLALEGVAVYGRHHTCMMILVSIFLVCLGVPTVCMVAVTATNPASSTIMRPAKHMRPTAANCLALAATVAEAVQLSASTFQVRPLPCSIHRALSLIHISEPTRPY